MTVITHEQDQCHCETVEWFLTDVKFDGKYAGFWACRKCGSKFVPACLYHDAVERLSFIEGTDPEGAVH